MPKLHQKFFPLALFATLFLPGMTRADWVQSGLGRQSIYSFAGNGVEVFALSDSGIYRGAENGKSWAQVNANLPKLVVNSISMIGNQLYACTRGGLYKSADYGGTWTATSLVKSNSVQTLRAYGNVFYAATAGPVSHVFVSTNGGESWADRTNGIPMNIVHDFEIVGSMVFAGSDGQGILVSSNNGANWTRSDKGYPQNTPSVSAFEAAGSDLWLSGDGGIYVSTDGGASWLKKSKGLPMVADFGGIVAKGELLYAAVDGLNAGVGGIYVSKNRGEDWGRANTGLTGSRISGMHINGDFLFVSMVDGGVWRRPLAELEAPGAIPVLTPVFKGRDVVLTLEPDGSARLRYVLGKASLVSISLRDLQGKEIFRAVDAVQAKGGYALPLDMASGLHGKGIIEFSAGENRQRLRF